MTDKELLYNYFLNEETTRYNKAKNLLDMRDFSTLTNSFVHYVKTERKSVRIDNGKEADEVISIITKVKNTLPNNADKLVINSNHTHEEEQWIELSWIEYTMPSEDTPTKLANNWSRDAIWKLEKQQNGKDAKRYKKILDKLKNN